MHPKKLNTTSFIEKFNSFYHNHKFSFENTTYIDSNTPLTLTCREHGDQKVIPYKLFKSHITPCSKCRKTLLTRVVDTKSFIEKSNFIYNNQYNYSQSNYINNSTPLTITCPEHGTFTLTPDEHLSSLRGCPKCAKNNITSTKEEVLKTFERVHKGKYEYPEFDYINGKQVIDILCKDHGIFKQKIETHKLGHGCKECGKTTSNTGDFIKKSTQTHGNLYDYSKSNYIRNKNRISIICPLHGEFKPFPSDHIRGEGCPKCNRDKNNIIFLERFIKKSNIIHQGKYDYSNSKYLGRIDRISIICPVHGEFEQLVGDHLQGCGCPKCANETLNYSSKYEEEIIDFSFWLIVGSLISARIYEVFLEFVLMLEFPQT